MATFIAGMYVGVGAILGMAFAMDNVNIRHPSGGCKKWLETSVALPAGAIGGATSAILLVPVCTGVSVYGMYREKYS